MRSCSGDVTYCCNSCRVRLRPLMQCTEVRSFVRLVLVRSVGSHTMLYCTVTCSGGPLIGWLIRLCVFSLRRRRIMIEYYKHDRSTCDQMGCPLGEEVGRREGLGYCLSSRICSFASVQGTPMCVHQHFALLPMLLRYVGA